MPVCWSWFSLSCYQVPPARSLRRGHRTTILITPTWFRLHAYGRPDRHSGARGRSTGTAVALEHSGEWLGLRGHRPLPTHITMQPARWLYTHKSEWRDSAKGDDGGDAPRRGEPLRWPRLWTP
jgi:hypothetical protein